MDPFSQAALGALAARVVMPDGMKGRVLLAGAAAGALPDIDVVLSFGGDVYDHLVTHRGITHSLFFAPVVGPLLGWLFHRLNARGDPARAHERRYWMWAMTVALWSHPLLDLVTPYGTQLLMPFSDARFAIYAMPIIDPVFTLILIVGLVLCRWVWVRRQTAAVALALGTAYLGYGWWLNVQAADFAARDLAARGIEFEQVQAFPTVLQPYVRRVVARSAYVDRVGWVSPGQDCGIVWGVGERAAPDLEAQFAERREGRIFSWFGMGWTHYGVRDDGTARTFVASDLRYGTTLNVLDSVFQVEVPLTPEGTVEVLSDAPAGGGTLPSTDERLAWLDTLFADRCSDSLKV